MTTCDISMHSGNRETGIAQHDYESRDIVCVVVAVSKITQQTSALTIWNGSEASHNLSPHDAELLAEDPDLVDCFSSQLLHVTVCGKHNTRDLVRLIGKYTCLEGVGLFSSAARDLFYMVLNLSKRKCKITVLHEPPALLVKLLNAKKGKKLNGQKMHRESTEVSAKTECIQESLPQTTEIAASDTEITRKAIEKNCDKANGKVADDTMMVQESIGAFGDLYENLSCSSGASLSDDDGVDMGKEIAESVEIKQKSSEAQSLSDRISSIDVTDNYIYPPVEGRALERFIPKDTEAKNNTTTPETCIEMQETRDGLKDDTHQLIISRSSVHEASSSDYCVHTRKEAINDVPHSYDMECFSSSPLILQVTEWGSPTLYKSLPPVIVTHNVHHLKPIPIAQIRSRDPPFECRLVASISNIFPNSLRPESFIWATCKKCRKSITLSSLVGNPGVHLPCPWCKYLKLSLRFLLVLHLTDPSGKIFVFAKCQEAVDLFAGFTPEDVCNGLGARHVSKVLSKLRSEQMVFLDVILSAYENRDDMAYYRIVRTLRCRPL